MTARAGVSVIVPCYGSSETVPRAVESILAQTVLPDQLILVDDASVDGGRTLRTLRDIARGAQGKVDVEIVALDVNRGPGGARNAGWAVAVQPLVAFLDADDAWHPRKLEIQATFMRRHPEVTITAHSHVVRNPEDPRVWALPDTLRWSGFSYLRLLVRNVFLTPAVMLARDVPHRFEESQRRCEDFFLWLRLLSDGQKAAFLDVPLVCLYKPEFGAAGMSADLFAMERAELAMYSDLHRQKRLPPGSYPPLVVLSLAKFLRRMAMAAVRKGRA
jgi:teichuronic acid biosynthesis glycosyltransferase TuaG